MCILIYQSELFAPAWRQPGYMRQVHTATTGSSSCYHTLLFELSLDTDHNLVREEHVHVQHYCFTLEKVSIHELIQIFIRKIFVVQYYPQNMFNIENYGN